MGWETRARGGTYYTRSRREGGRVVREYVGAGGAAQAMAWLDAQGRREREESREAARAERDRCRREEEALADFCGGVEALTRAVLAEAGYHRHKRGEWRKRREEGEDMAKTDIAKDAREELAIRRAEVPESSAERFAVVTRALGGEKAAEAQALAVLRRHPGEVRLMWGSPLHPLLDLVGTKDPVMRQIVADEYEDKLRHVAGESPTPLERLLAERVVVCRMQLAHWERDYAAGMRTGLALDVSDCKQRRIDRTHRRLLAAIKALAQVRRLQLPAVQINVGQNQNIAERQVNVSVTGAALPETGEAARS